MKYAITPALVLVFLQQNIAFVKGNRLPPLEDIDLTSKNNLVTSLFDIIPILKN